MPVMLFYITYEKCLLCHTSPKNVHHQSLGIHITNIAHQFKLLPCRIFSVLIPVNVNDL